ncbi:MAG: enoyl-[acyl-carrier-protein] reductase FabI, partial [Burkholderiales bacterium]|nr:enoyl-[acyl-carrier-protein] reductase FabI [Burkholderiales bacterium]
MSFLTGKKILITGLLSDRSIAYGVAKACKAQGAELCFTYQSDRFEQRVRDLAAHFDSKVLFKCDVTLDNDIEQLFVGIDKQWGCLDGVLHSIAFVPKEGLTGSFVDNVNREVYQVSNDISSYSFLALAKYGRKLLTKSGGALITL